MDQALVQQSLQQLLQKKLVKIIDVTIMTDFLNRRTEFLG